MSDEFALVERRDLALMPPLYPEATDRLLYDGSCGLCHRVIRFVLRHDVTGSAFRFSPLDSQPAREALSAGTRHEELPDSVVVITERDEVLTRSDAALYVGKRLGGIWRALAMVGELVPRGVRDTVYDLIAAVRHELFERPEQACPIAPPRVRERFDT